MLGFAVALPGGLLGAIDGELSVGDELGDPTDELEELGPTEVCA